MKLQQHRVMLDLVLLCLAVKRVPPFRVSGSRFPVSISKSESVGVFPIASPDVTHLKGAAENRGQFKPASGSAVNLLFFGGNETCKRNILRRIS